MTRLDVWLDVACVFKTRSEAQRACKGGKVILNGHRAKPHREVKVGDRLEVTTDVRVGAGSWWCRQSPSTISRRPQARTLYEDVTPAADAGGGGAARASPTGGSATDAAGTGRDAHAAGQAGAAEA